MSVGERVVATAFAPRMGPVASAMLVAKAVLNLKPQLVVIVGICAGIQGKADIGDVIAADISWDWQSGKYFDKNGKEHFEISPHQIAIDEKTRSQLMLLKRDNDFWASLGTISAKYSRKPPKLVIGPIATGSSVLADARVSDRIKSTQHRNLAGLDMEVYGAYAAALYCDPNVRFLALKAVCDKGDRQKDDSFQQYASEVAAQTAVHFLRSYAEPLLS